MTADVLPPFSILDVPRPAAPGRYLVAIQDGAPVVRRLDMAIAHIGRAAHCTIRIDDSSVCSRHALIVSREGAVVLLDDRSDGGVRVNGEQVAQAVLADDDLIEIGRVRLRFIDTR
jgi:pSer/pThr/pTyr-binding forkhead associated (FHA) protein